MLARMIMLVLSVCIMLPVVASAADYYVGEGDTLKVAVWGNAELSTQVKVRPDGKITVPAVGDVVAAGMTPAALSDTLKSKISQFVRNPTVTVTVETISNNRVYVFGNGVKPSVYNLERRTTLLQLLSMVDDVRSADLRRAYLMRNGQKIKENFYSLFVQGNVSENMDMEINDAVFIPPLHDRNVYVVGAVNTPKPIVYRENMTVMEAILEAGGFTKFARESSTLVMRKEGGRDTILNVRLKDLMKSGDLSQNIKLQPGDYVVVQEGIF
ncbi:MAG TPA: polysaccharide biosynthesis/export family protein [Dissulfurispiraceae bacterium]|nr:polysaccharide biosynthesis/export family protein [Dissulfurispiraceae bacterium]